jgi:AbrB family looped-hinge helix DNA binding protein
MALAKKATTVVSTKGQVILPKAIRDSKGWGPGKELVVEETQEGVLLRRQSFSANQARGGFRLFGREGEACEDRGLRQGDRQ